MTDAKSAMLEIALRAVQQHLERDEYTAAGDVVMQALARAEQMTAPVNLVRRLLADHQRVEPHHADQCQLCRDATAAIEGKPEQGERQPVYGCHCDLEPDMVPDGCVIDQGMPHHCIYAKHIERKEQCSYWQPIAVMK